MNESLRLPVGESFLLDDCNLVSDQPEREGVLDACRLQPVGEGVLDAAWGRGCP